MLALEVVGKHPDHLIVRGGYCELRAVNPGFSGDFVVLVEFELIDEFGDVPSAVDLL
ncbi:MAG: hypothetical protein GY937_10450 [bacterium]|nr:hypothetical protein [bacterium]